MCCTTLLCNFRQFRHHLWLDHMSTFGFWAPRTAGIPLINNCNFLTRPLLLIFQPAYLHSEYLLVAQNRKTNFEIPIWIYTMLNEACRSRSTTYFSEEWWHAWVKGDKKYVNFFDFQSIRSRYIIYEREGGVKRPFALYYTDHVMYWKMDPIIYDFLINKMQKNNKVLIYFKILYFS